MMSLLLIAFLLGASTAQAEDLTGVEFVKAYDGDTLTVNIPGLPAVFGHHLSVRLAGLDAPEIKGRCDQEKYLAMLARSVLNAKLRKAKEIILQDVKPDKYFRLDAIVLADGVNINQEMLDSGLARPYSGGKRKGWC